MKYIIIDKITGKKVDPSLIFELYPDTSPADVLCQLLENIDYEYEIIPDWNEYPTFKPQKYGKYEVYRAGCNKQHYATWNGTGWAYNNNDITHWREIIKPIKCEQMFI